MLQLQNISISMRKDLRELLRDFTFSLNPGDKAAVIGEEGNGKSTLLKLIYDENMVEGYVEWSGTVRKNGLVLGYLAQELPAEDKWKTAYEFCCEESSFLDSTPRELADAAAALRFSQELFYSDRTMGALSGVWPFSLCAARTATFWTNPPTTWISKPWNGWRNLSAAVPSLFCIFPTTKCSWKTRPM